jgi:hypothetical protein
MCACRFTHSSDADFAKYRCPVFKGFVISVSGMDGDERQHVRNLVEQNGQWIASEIDTKIYAFAMILINSSDLAYL